MDSWEEEYQKQVAREDEMYRRKLREMARRRDHRRKLMVLCSAAALFIIVTAVIVAVSLKGSDGGPSGGSVPGGPDPETSGTGSSEGSAGTVPGNIVLPDWVEEDLLPLNEYSRPGYTLPEVNGVVVHYVGNPNTTARQNRSYFAGLAQSHATSASSHFIVGLEGEVILCVPLDEISYCSNSRNYDTIAIEVCHPDETGKFNDATMASLVKLLKWLCDTYGLTRDQVIRHYDVIGKICPKYYVEHPDAWEKLKDDVFG